MSAETLNEQPTHDLLDALGNAREPLVAAMARAYHTACEHHDPDRGADAQTFGFCLYKYAVHEIADEATRSEKLIKISSRNPTFRFAIDGFEFACHRVGDSEYDDIAVSFPGNDGAVVRMIERQLWLDHVPRPKALTEARSIVLAHMGNPEDGLRAMYLCIPQEAKDGRITRWAHTQLLWRADLAETPAMTTSVTERAPVEQVQSPQVARRARKVSDERKG